MRIRGRCTMAGLAMMICVGVCGCVPPPPPAQITVKLVNDASVTMDPHLYISGSKVSSDALFVAVNMYANFGGSTVIAAGATVSVVLGADAVATIGSQAATFGDWTDWTNAGTSVDSPVRQIDSDYASGDVVTLRFYRDSEGAYHTDVTTTSP